MQSWRTVRCGPQKIGQEEEVAALVRPCNVCHLPAGHGPRSVGRSARSRLFGGFGDSFECWETDSDVPSSFRDRRGTLGARRAGRYTSIYIYIYIYTTTTTTT